MPTSNKHLEVQALHCKHGSVALFEEVSFHLQAGELCALLGPSGCGKTTLLRAIAGLQPLQSGNIQLNDQDISCTPPEKRGIGMVFQDYALFPHMTVAENIGFGVKDRKIRALRTNEMLSLVDLESYGKRYIQELSGGQQQRVALARALAPNPKLILLDEPFSNLDSELRQSLCQRVKEILQRAKVTAIMVTHDQTEAFTFADHIGLLLNGRLQQFASPHDLYYHPATLDVAKFIGKSQLIPATIDNNGNLNCAFVTLSNVHDTAGDYWLLSRPENWVLSNTATDRPVSIAQKTFFGHETRYHVSTENSPLHLTVTMQSDGFQTGDRLHLTPNFKSVRYFKRYDNINRSN